MTTMPMPFPVPHACYEGNFDPSRIRMPRSSQDMAAMLRIAYRSGFKDGNDLGYKDGYNLGRQDGYDDGYQDGYNDGLYDG